MAECKNNNVVSFYEDLNVSNSTVMSKKLMYTVQELEKICNSLNLKVDQKMLYDICNMMDMPPDSPVRSRKFV
jgi:hypothetical protein